MNEKVEYMMYFDRETNTSKELVLKEKYDKLQQQLDKYKTIVDEIETIDIFKEFTFPLMKRWEEQQVLSSIDYQFKNTFIQKIKELKGSDK